MVEMAPWYNLPNQKLSETQIEGIHARVQRELNLAIQYDSESKDLERSFISLLELLNIKGGLLYNPYAIDVVMYCLRLNSKLVGMIAAKKISTIPYEFMVDIAKLLLSQGIKEVVEILANQICKMRYTERVQVVELFLDTHPKLLVQNAWHNFIDIPKEQQLSMLRRLVGCLDKEAILELAKESWWMDKYIHFEFAELLLQQCFSEVAPILANQLGNDLDVVNLILEHDPSESAIVIAGKNSGQNAQIAKVLLSKAFSKSAGIIAFNLVNFQNEDDQFNIAQILLKEKDINIVKILAQDFSCYNPKLQALISDHCREFPGIQLDQLHFSTKNQGDTQDEIKVNVEQRCKNLISFIGFFDLHSVLQIIQSLLEVNSLEVSKYLLNNLHEIPNQYYVEVLSLISRRPSAEYLKEPIVQMVNTLSVEQRNELRRRFDFIESNCKNSTKSEREELELSETRNPTIYKNIHGPFVRREFVKTGSRTQVLGGKFEGKLLVRIIPTEAFVAWAHAYTAVEYWNSLGFDYVPIEPIVRAKVDSEHGLSTKVFAGILGVNIHRYLKMQSTVSFHAHVRQQTERIKKGMQGLHIEHGHTHEGNFCILHARNKQGDIDWSLPPRVYCIDFDRAKYEEFSEST